MGLVGNAMHMYILETSIQNFNARSRTGISKTSNETKGCKIMGKAFKLKENCRKIEIKKYKLKLNEKQIKKQIQHENNNEKLKNEKENDQEHVKTYLKMINAMIIKMIKHDNIF